MKKDTVVPLRQPEGQDLLSTMLREGAQSPIAGRAGRERLLRYCARPPFALERLQQRDAEHLLYEAGKPGPGGSGLQILTPLQLLDRLAALVPPPRIHRHGTTACWRRTRRCAPW